MPRRFRIDRFSYTANTTTETGCVYTVDDFRMEVVRRNAPAKPTTLRFDALHAYLYGERI